MHDDPVYITRDEPVCGYGTPRRVFVTGPHFGQAIYSRTTQRAEATVFSRTEAERLLAEGEWSWRRPKIEDAR
jgi:hypothetical protein